MSVNRAAQEVTHLLVDLPKMLDKIPKIDNAVTRTTQDGNSNANKHRQTQQDKVHRRFASGRIVKQTQAIAEEAWQQQSKHQ